MSRHHPETAKTKMPAGEFRRHLVRLGLNLRQAAHALGVSYDHARALASGRDPITRRVADDLRSLTLMDAMTARLDLWERDGYDGAQEMRALHPASRKAG